MQVEKVCGVVGHAPPHRLNPGAGRACPSSLSKAFADCPPAPLPARNGQSHRRPPNTGRATIGEPLRRIRFGIPSNLSFKE